MPTGEKRELKSNFGGWGQSHMITNFAIFRRESSGGYSSRGPIAPVMSLEQARREIARLRTTYPHQVFVILGEIGETARERTAMHNEAREL